MARRVIRGTRGFTRSNTSKGLKAHHWSVDHRNVQHDQPADPAFIRAIAAARRGQAPGFEWLWNRFSRQIVAFAASQGSDDADGIANEVFLAVFRKIDVFEGGDDGFVALLFSIARNKVIDEHRKQGRRVRTQRLSGADDRAGGDVETDALEALTSESASILAVLTDEQREVLHLRLIADLSLEQTAKATGRSVNAVKALQHRATNALRRTISEEAVTR